MFLQNKHVPADEKVNVSSSDIFIVASGELTISTTLPSENKQSGNTKGYLCKKMPGDIINKGQAQKDAKRKGKPYRTHTTPPATHHTAGPELRRPSEPRVCGPFVHTNCI